MNLKFSNTPIGKLRLTGLAEGTSFLILLLIAMPLKHFANLPQAVKIVGWAHGILFILYIIALIRVWVVFKWSLKRVIIAFIAALVPLGTFVFDKQLRKEEQTLK